MILSYVVVHMNVPIRLSLALLTDRQTFRNLRETYYAFFARTA